MARVCPSCKEAYPSSQTICPKCRVLTDFVPEAEVMLPPQSPNYQGYYHMGVGGHMKWFKFLIYFVLFVYMAAYGLGALSYILFAVFSDSEALTQVVGETQLVLIIVYSIAMLPLAVMTFMARRKLAKFQKNAGRFFLCVWIAQICIGMIFSIAMSSFGDVKFAIELANGYHLYYSFGASETIASIVFGVTIEAAIVYANYVYFSKREHLFVN